MGQRLDVSRWLTLLCFSYKESIMELNPRLGTPDFKWQGWLKDFLGLKFSIPIFFFWRGGEGGRGRKIWQVFFWEGIFGGIQDSKFADTSIRDYGLLILSNEMKILVLQNVKLEFQQLVLDHYCFLLGPDLWSLNNCNQKRKNNHY